VRGWVFFFFYKKRLTRQNACLRTWCTCAYTVGGAWEAPFFCYYGNETPAHQPGRGTEVPNCKLSLRVCVCVCVFCTRVYVCLLLLSKYNARRLVRVKLSVLISLPSLLLPRHTRTQTRTAELLWKQTVLRCSSD